MRAALRQRNGCHWQRKNELDWKLESRGNSARAHTQLALVVRKADDTAGDKSGNGGHCSGVSGERCQQPASDAERCENDAASGGGARFPLMALGQLGLDHLAGFET